MWSLAIMWALVCDQFSNKKSRQRKTQEDSYKCIFKDKYILDREGIVFYIGNQMNEN